MADDDESLAKPLVLLRCYTGQDALQPRPYSQTHVELPPASVVAVKVDEAQDDEAQDDEAHDDEAQAEAHDPSLVRCWVENRGNELCIVANMDQRADLDLLVNGRPLTRPRTIHAGDRLVFMRTAADAVATQRALAVAGHGTHAEQEAPSSQVVAVVG